MQACSRNLGAVAGLWLGLVVLGGCYRPIVPPPEPDIASRDAYRIGTSDVLTIRVWRNPELSLEAVPVRPDGKISVPLVNDVQAAGLTTQELKEMLSQALVEYVTTPDVTVIVTQMNSRRVFVNGEVARSGPVSLVQEMRVLDAITTAGGFTTFANRRKIKIIRMSPDGVKAYRFNYKAFESGKAPESNFLLHNGDTIVVPD